MFELWLEYKIEKKKVNSGSLCVQFLNINNACTAVPVRIDWFKNLLVLVLNPVVLNYSSIKTLAWKGCT